MRSATMLATPDLPSGSCAAPPVMANSIATIGTDAIGPASDVFDAKPGGQRAAIPAGERSLVILCIDRFGDKLGFDPFEIFGANRPLPDIRDHLVDHLLDLRKFDTRPWRSRDR